jgi:hypothetical protein
VAALDELGELVDHRPCLGHVGVGPFDREPVAPEENRAAEPLAERAENAVVKGGELGGDIVGNRKNLLHGASV